MSGIISFSESGRKMSAYDFMGLQWSSSPPTVEGLYRAKWKDMEYIVWVEATDLAKIGILSIYVFGNDVAYSVGDFTHWLGPLPVPEPPQ